MVALIAMLSSGKGTWAQVSSLIKLGSWDKIYLVCNEFAYDTFDIDPKKALKLKIDEKRPKDMVTKLSHFFKKEIKDFEVALNFASGTGLEHMALVSAILKAGLGIRFVYADFNEVKEFNLLDQRFEDEESY